MQVSRRDFLRVTAGAGAGTAIGGLVGLGATLAPARAQAQELRIRDAKAVPSICPFCSVGCATLVHVKGDRIVNIEGDPRSPQDRKSTRLNSSHANISYAVFCLKKKKKNKKNNKRNNNNKQRKYKYTQNQEHR